MRLSNGMWIAAFCAALVACGLGCSQQPLPGSPDAPISIAASIEGRGQAGVLIVTVSTQVESRNVLLELSLPAGVRIVAGNTRTTTSLKEKRPATFRYGLKADSPGVYVINLKVTAGDESYRFGRTVTVSWLAQSD
jgi:hypothetical protein